MTHETFDGNDETETQRRITVLLLAAERGDRAALEECFPLVYDELRVLAHRQRGAWHGNLTLNTTALVHEAYLKLVDQRRIGATSRGHFFAIAATAMRHILCNYARDQNRKKRGGDAQRVSLDDADGAVGQTDLSDESAKILAALGEAVQWLAHIDKRQSQIIECRFFAAMTVEETAAALDISPATVKRDWLLARARLYRQIQNRIPSIELT
jgi:RNA polymerase sigma factor (TIGR02999 family)